MRCKRLFVFPPIPVHSRPFDWFYFGINFWRSGRCLLLSRSLSLVLFGYTHTGKRKRDVDQEWRHESSVSYVAALLRERTACTAHGQCFLSSCQLRILYGLLVSTGRQWESAGIACKCPLNVLRLLAVGSVGLFCELLVLVGFQYMLVGFGHLILTCLAHLFVSIFSNSHVKYEKY